jgi:hypothetical protein
MKGPATAARLVNLLVPLAAGEALPAVQSQKLDGEHLTLGLKWADGKVESIDLNVGWSAKQGQLPAVISVK